MRGQALQPKSRVPLLTARAARAFHEYMPIARDAAGGGAGLPQGRLRPLLDIFFLDMRSYRGPNTDNRQSETTGPDTVFLGRDADRVAQARAMASRATWKVIAADMPLGADRVRQCRRDRTGSEAVAQGDGPALGRELEIAELLSFIKRARHPQHRVADRGRALYGRALL